MNASRPLRSATLTALLYTFLVLLSLWSWTKWQNVWVERSEGFFPPEFGQIHDLDELAWRYPVYRSNDSYHWVANAAALSAGDSSRLHHYMDEGPQASGRANAWHSGLTRYLETGGRMLAAYNDWPTLRGITSFAHWAGSPLLLGCVLLGAILIQRMAGSFAGLVFMALYFFSPAIAWDFHFSRIDHESCFQIAVLLQALGLIGCLQGRSHYWGVCAGIGSGIGWWIGATPQAAIGLCLCFAVVVQSLLHDTQPRTAKSLLIWGMSGSVCMLLLGSLDARWSHTYGLSAWHPVYALAQLACGLVAYACYQRKPAAGCVAVILGLSPLILLLTHGGDTHVWLDPFMRRLHGFIVEFQSPFSNGLWSQWNSLATALAALLATYGLVRARPQARAFLAILLAALAILALLQTRWLGLLASVSVITIAMSLSKTSNGHKIATLVFGSVLIVSWILTWTRIEAKPGKLFVADLFLQTGARDICLNLDYQLNSTQQSDAVVALPFSFAPVAARFDEIHPLGSFYWENRDGLYEASKLYASTNDAAALQQCKQQGIRYIVVQRMQLGDSFAQLTLQALDAEQRLESSLAWRLSHGNGLPTWCTEVPFYGTFDPARFSARIYEVNYR